IVAPAVIRTDEALGISAPFGAHHRAAVGTAVDQDADSSVVFSCDDDGLAAHPGREIVARRLHLAFVSEHQPGAAEDALHLELEDRRIGVHRAVHAIRLHQHRELFVGGHEMIVAMATVVAHLLAPSGAIPNHRRWPLLVYPQALPNPTPEDF